MYYQCQARQTVRLFAVNLIVLCAALITGCEAPLVLDAVDEQRKNPIQRTDRFQAATNNGTSTVVVGNQGVIIHSSDNGVTWHRQIIEDWPALIDVTACPDGDLAVLSYDKTVYLSSDHGANWLAKKIPTEETPQSITCAPDNDLWVVGSFTFMWHSEDKGETWDETTLNEDSIFTTVQFVDEHIGYVLGEFGIFLKTTDGGVNWESMPPLPNEFYAQSALFRTADKGWVTGLGGKILHTADGGATWQEQETDVPVALYSIADVNDTLYVAGGEGTLLQLDGDRWLPLKHDKPLRLYLRALTGVNNELLVGGVSGTLHLIPLTGA